MVVVPIPMFIIGAHIVCGQYFLLETMFLQEVDRLVNSRLSQRTAYEFNRHRTSIMYLISLYRWH